MPYKIGQPIEFINARGQVERARIRWISNGFGYFHRFAFDLATGRIVGQDTYIRPVEKQVAWQSVANAPERVVVHTKIDDEDGLRNECTLKRIGNLWFIPDGSMYVYYRPTHWRPL